MYDVNFIKSCLPHRYPFLLVDRILDISDNKIIGIKNVTANEPFFVGHFPEKPVMPGVLILEAMAQCGGVLVAQKIENPSEKLVFFMSIDKAKFRKVVEPGDQLKLVVELLRFQGKIVKMKTEAYVEDVLVCEAEMVATLADKPKE